MSKCTKVKQKYRRDYTKEWPVLLKSKTSDHHVFCAVCRCEVSVQYGGRDDCRRHVISAKHTENAKRASENTDVRSFFGAENEQIKVTRAEVLFVNFLIEHNLPLAAADHASPLFGVIFSDSKIAQKFSCRRTKATNIVRFLAQTAQETLTNLLRSQPFSLATDGSHDRQSDTQLYPVVVRLFDTSLGHVVELLLEIPSCKKACTGENIFILLNDVLSARGIPWSNCISFQSDSASVMIGRHKGVAAFIKREQPSVYVQGCMCHLMHIAAERAAHALPVSAEELLIDIFYYLEKSSKRVMELRKFQQLCGVETHKILKHVTTRWLSLGTCIKRLLEQWEPLNQYVSSQIPKSKTATSKRSLPNTLNAEHGEPPSKKRVPPKESDTNTSVKGSITPDAKNNESKRTKCSTAATKTSGTKISKGRGTTAAKPSKNDKASSITAAKTSGAERAKGRDTEAAKPSKNDKASSITAAKTSGTESAKSKKAGSAAETTGSKRTKGSSTSSVRTSGAECDKQSSTSRIQRLNIAFQNPVTKVYILFLDHTIPVFDNFNKLLQQEDPVIHIMKKTLLNMFSELLVRFVTPQAIVKSTTVLDVDYTSRDNQKDRHDLVIGASTKRLISELKSGGHISGSELKEFYSSVRLYFCTALDYIKKNFPFSDDLLNHAQILDITNRAVATFSSLEYFVKRFPCLVKDDVEMDKLELEFIKYQVDPQISDLKSESVDRMWSTISHLDDPATGQARYPTLCKVMQGVLVIAHSNAQSERVFSLVRKNRTEYRPTLSDQTLEALLIQKVHLMVTGRACYEHKYSQQLLCQAKSATYKALSSSGDHKD